MIVTIGGVKGGVGKTTVAVNLAVMRAAAGNETLLIDADDQASSTDFTMVRHDSFGDTGYTSIQLHGSAVRSEGKKLASKYRDVIIDVGGRDTAGQRAALTLCEVLAIPFLPSSFDVWALEKIAELVDEAKSINDNLRAICFVNRADARGADNQEALELASEIRGLEILEGVVLGNRKAFRNAASQGLAVTELKPVDDKAVAEMHALYTAIFGKK